MSAIEFALREDPQADVVFRFPSPCPQHPEGDAGRLDVKATGWPGAKCSGAKRHRCTPIWRVSFLCDVLHVEYYCDRELPAHLRALTR